MELLSVAEIDMLAQIVKLLGDKRLWIVTGINRDKRHKIEVQTLDGTEKRIVGVTDIVIQRYRHIAKRYAALSPAMAAANLILNERSRTKNSRLKLRDSVKQDETLGFRECRHRRKARVEKRLENGK